MLCVARICCAAAAVLGLRGVSARGLRRNSNVSRWTTRIAHAAGVDGYLLPAATAFEAIELSPLAPLGVCSSIALASQN